MKEAPQFLPTNCQYQWLKKLFSKVKQVDPTRVDRVFIESVEGHFHEGSIRKLALFLDIAEIHGNRGKNYDKLKDYPSEYFKRNLREIVLEKYSTFVGDGNLTTVTRESVIDQIIRHYQIKWDKARLAVNVLVQLCRMAEIPVSDSLRIDKKWKEQDNIRRQRSKTKSENPIIENKVSDEFRLTPRKVKRIAKWIKLNRTQAGLNQYRLAVKLGVYPEEIKQWESGDSAPTKEVVERIAKILNVSIDPRIVNGLKQWVKRRREESGLTRQELAQKAGISTLDVRLIEIGAVENPTKITISSLERILGKMPSELNQEIQEKRKAGEFDYSGPFPKDGWRDILKKEGTVPCFYVLYDTKKQPIYVGQTSDLERRFLQYEKGDFKFIMAKSFAYVAVKDEDFRRKMEDVMIKVLGEYATFNVQQKI